MDIRVSKNDVKNASAGSLLMVLESGAAYVIERNANGGIDTPLAAHGCFFFPITMLKEQIDHPTPTLAGGDWTVIPYVRDNGKDVVSVDAPGCLVIWA